jgi:hypothetical protein
MCHGMQPAAARPEGNNAGRRWAPAGIRESDFMVETGRRRDMSRDARKWEKAGASSQGDNRSRAESVGAAFGRPVAGAA